MTTLPPRQDSASGVRPPDVAGDPRRSTQREVGPLIRTTFNELNAEVSPDGRLMAYQSNESGRTEIYVRPFPAVEGGRWQVSTAGGQMPLWARSGEELFYVTTDDRTMMGVRVERAPTWRGSTPTRVFREQRSVTAGNGRTFDITPDGRRFLVIKESGDEASASTSLIVVQHWLEELKQLVPR